MTASLQPSYWQQLVFGIGVIVPTLLVGAVLLAWFTRSVLVPGAAGRRWPEGTRWFRPIVELVVDTQREPVGGVDQAGSYPVAVRFGLVAAACVVIPVTAGAVVVRPGLGIHVLPLLLAADAVVTRLAGRKHTPVGRGTDRSGDLVFRMRLAAAGLVALAAGAVQAQWGTGSLYDIVAAQVDRPIPGLSWAGLPTVFVQPLAAILAVAAVHVTLCVMPVGAARAAGALPRLSGDIVDQAWLVAAAAWLVCVFAGGGAVPWGIDVDGTRHVVSINVFALKVVLVVLALAWARARWPTVPVRFVRALVAVGTAAGVGSIVVTLAIRHFV